MTHPQKVTPREELGAHPSSTFLPDLLRGEGAGRFAEGSDVCPRPDRLASQHCCCISARSGGSLVFFGATFTQLFSLSPFDRDSKTLGVSLSKGSSGIWEGCGNARRVQERSVRGGRVEGSLQKRRWGDSWQAPSFPN